MEGCGPLEVPRSVEVKQLELRLLVRVGAACDSVVRTTSGHTMGESRIFVIQFVTCYTHLCVALKYMYMLKVMTDW